MIYLSSPAPRFILTLMIACCCFLLLGLRAQPPTSSLEDEDKPDKQEPKNKKGRTHRQADM